MAGYSEDLAYIHDVGYGDFARAAAPALLDALRAQGIASGLVEKSRTKDLLAAGLL